MCLSMPWAHSHQAENQHPPDPWMVGAVLRRLPSTPWIAHFCISTLFSQLILWWQSSQTREWRVLREQPTRKQRSSLGVCFLQREGRWLPQGWPESEHQCSQWFSLSLPQVWLAWTPAGRVRSVRLAKSFEAALRTEALQTEGCTPLQCPSH